MLRSSLSRVVNRLAGQAGRSQLRIFSSVLPGYASVARALSAEAYVDEVIAGTRSDPVLSVHLKDGWLVVKATHSYLQDDPESASWAAVITWVTRRTRRRLNSPCDDCLMDARGVPIKSAPSKRNPIQNVLCLDAKGVPLTIIRGGHSSERSLYALTSTFFGKEAKRCT